MTNTSEQNSSFRLRERQKARSTSREFRTTSRRRHRRRRRRRIRLCRKSRLRIARFKRSVLPKRPFSKSPKRKFRPGLPRFKRCSRARQPRWEFKLGIKLFELSAVLFFNSCVFLSENGFINGLCISDQSFFRCW